MASGPAPLGPAQFDSAIALPADLTKLGGFSGVELGPEDSFVAISDRGHILRGTMIRQNGRLTGLKDWTYHPLRGTQGNPVRGKANDAEGLALGPDRTLYVSFEGVHRILSYPAGQSLPTQRIAPPVFRDFPQNGGLESLAVDRHGTLYALPERTWRRGGGTPLFRRTKDGWTELPGYTRNRGFLPVGADIGPDGRIYILERHFKGLGFATRIRAFAISPHGMSDPQLILQTPARRHGNLEGLSVWQDTHGQIRLTMVSDDNFLSLLRGEIVEYTMPSALANKAEAD